MYFIEKDDDDFYYENEYSSFLRYEEWLEMIQQYDGNEFDDLIEYHINHEE